MEKLLILNADDFGCSDFIDNGIIKGINEGVVNSVSALVTFEGSGDRITNNLIPAAQEKGAKIGLHLCITAGYSAQDHSTLTTGIGSDFVWLKNLVINRISPEELKQEIRWQIEFLGNLLGGVDQIDHINHHHGIFYFDQLLFNCFMEVLNEYKAQNIVFPLRSPIIWSKSGLIYYDYSPFFPSIPIKKTALKSPFGISIFKRGRSKAIIRLLRGSSLQAVKQIQEKLDAYNPAISFCSIDHYYGQANKHNLEKIVEHLPDDGRAVELMLHLGDGSFAGDNPWGINSAYFPKRQKELDVLIENKHLLNAVQLINYGDVT